MRSTAKRLTVDQDRPIAGVVIIGQCKMINLRWVWVMVSIGLYASTTLPAVAQVKLKPRIVIVGTGGTIAGVGDATANIGAYRSAVVSVDAVVKSVPKIGQIATVISEQVLQIGSQSFNNERLLMSTVS